MFERKRGTGKVVEHLPIAARLLLRSTPERLVQSGLSFWLNRIFKQAIKRGELDFLEQRYARIIIDDIALDFSLTLIDQKLQPTLTPPLENLCIKAKLTDFLLLITGKIDPDTLFFRRRLMVSGDTELGLSLKNFLDTLDASTLLPPRLYPLLDTLAEACKTQDRNAQ